MLTIRRTSALVLGAALALTPVLATAAHAAPDITLTSQQLTDAGFPKKPNVTAWGGTAQLPSSTAPQWQDVIITGKAPKEAQPGQLLTMSRFIATDQQGSGREKPLNITAVVQGDRSFALHFQLGIPGTYGYAVGYSTGGSSPEFVGFQFQFTTTGDGKVKPKAGQSTAVTLGPKKLAAAGFTKTPNVVGWGGTATISTNRAPAGAPVTIKGTAPDWVKPGTTLMLERFTATDKQGSGSMTPVGTTQTVVKADGSFELTFEINETGRYGYTLGAQEGEEWVGIEFQLKTT